MTVICFAFAVDVDVQALGDIFYRYTPQVAWRGQRAVFLEVSQCHKLYTPAGVIQRCVVHLQKLGLQPRVAMANTPPRALALAIHRKNMVADLPIESLELFALPFRTDEVLQKNLAAMIGHLGQLGVTTLRDFHALKTPSLLSRFGSLGWLVAQNTREDAKFVWPRFVPAAVVEEHIEFDPEFPVDNIEPILFQLKNRIDKIYLRLRGQGHRLKRLGFRLQPEHGQHAHELDLTLANGVLTPKVIFQIARERLQLWVQRAPLTQRISSCKVQVLETTPYRLSQRDLFHPKKMEEDEEYNSLVSRLRVRLGQEAVFGAQTQASFVPEFNWSKSPGEKATAPLEPVIPVRPLRILKTPLKAVPVEGAIFWDGQKILLRDFSQREVVLSEWWNDISERVYFRVCTQNGQQLWLFRSREGLFIHGFFD